MVEIWLNEVCDRCYSLFHIIWCYCCCCFLSVLFLRFFALCCVVIYFLLSSFYFILFCFGLLSLFIMSSWLKVERVQKFTLLIWYILYIVFLIIGLWSSLLVIIWKHLLYVIRLGLVYSIVYVVHVWSLLWSLFTFLSTWKSLWLWAQGLWQCEYSSIP